ncbi:MFS transporter [Actinomadura rubrisoli]|uniref:MFS transporter n=1 Tax=Actinomadura rubrisoli TaxID=2530368 RepID=A0A4R5C8Q8_9ACTN|nr:MFS transporter [Actinomadura rubrisoli]TDD93444.1 MFS transporter [Actinomadura rubrisoli]
MSSTPARRHRLGLTLTLLAFGQLIISLDYNIVYVALPDIGGDLGFSEQNLQWVISAYAVAYGGLLLLGGRASDLFGRRRMFVFGLALYGLSSLAGGLATHPGLLLAARAVQGIGGAFLFPATLSLVSTTFAEGRERNRAMAVWATAGAGGMVLGSLLGGVLTQAFGWAAVFYVNVPLALAGILAAFPLIAPDGPRGTGRSFDLPGALTATAGTTLIVFALVQGPESGWNAPPVAVAVAAGAVLLAAFVLIERRGSDPLMPLRLFRNRHLSAGIATTFLFMATFGTLVYFLMVYFQTVQGYSPLRTGVAYLVPMAAVVAGSNLGGHLATRFGTRATLVAGLSLGVAGTVWLGFAMAPHGSYVALTAPMLIFSFGQGIVFTTMFAAASTGVPPHEYGVASGMASTGLQVGSAVGLAVLVGVANAGTGGRTGEALRVAVTDGLREAVFVAAVGIAALIPVAFAFGKADKAPSTDGSAETAAVHAG